METVNYKGVTLTLDYLAQLDNYRDSIAWYSTAHDADGNSYEIRWDYIEPAWAENLTPGEKNNVTDLSDFADWENPAEIKED